MLAFAMAVGGAASAVPGEGEGEAATGVRAAPTPGPTPTRTPRPSASSSATPPVAAAAAVPHLTVNKEAVDVPDPLVPGSVFTYRITVSCSSLAESCVSTQLGDVLPEGLEIEQLPSDTAGYQVAYDESTGKVTVDFTDPLPSPPNPEGSVGLAAGGSQDILISVRVPEGDQFQDGDKLVNTAVVTADNAETVKDSATNTVEVPKKPSVSGSKSWSPSGTVATSGDKSTITLGAANTSSTSTDVGSVTITDTDPDLWNNFDLAQVGPVTQMPKGADQVTVSVCTKPGGDCAPDELISGPPGPGPDLSLPAGVDPGDVTGVVYTFGNSKGTPLPYDPNGAKVQTTVVLRDEERDSGAPINPDERRQVENCATPSVTFRARASVDGTDACASHNILPNTASVAMDKKFFSDTNGDWKQDGTAVIGTKPGITSSVTATNTSPFDVSEITITEPSESAPSEFDKTDMTQARLTFPAGATSAEMTVVCRDGTTLPAKKFTNPPAQQTTALGCPDGGPAASVTVTYRGTTSDGKGAIKQNSVAGLDLHGTLNDTADEGDAEDGVRNCADASATNPANGSGSAAGNVCATLKVENPRQEGNGTKDASQTSVPPGQPFTFGIGLTNRGNVPLDNVIVSDPADPTAEPNAFDQVRITSITPKVSPSDLDYKLQVYDPDAGKWVAYDADDKALLARARGVRIVVPDGIPVGGSVHADVTVVLRDGVTDGTITNCAVATTDGDPLGNEFCSDTAEIGPASSAASLNKTLSPSTVSRPYPGSPAANVHATLTVVNTGNVNLGRLTATDFDGDFFDAVDFVSLDGVSFPKGADQVRVDVCTARCATSDPEIVQGEWTGSTKPGLPDGVSAGEVRGIRVVFRSSDGDKIVPVEGKPSFNGACSNASVCFTVKPRETLRSNPDKKIPASLEDTVKGSGSSDKHGTFTIPPADATLKVDDGDPRLRVEKTQNAVVSPGVSQPFTLRVKNTGDAPLKPLSVSDPIPDGVTFDDTFAGDGGMPYTVTVTTPDGTAKPKNVKFTTDKDADGNVTGLHWDFPDWTMYPSAEVTITFRVKLKGGVPAGTKIPNVFGAGSPSYPDIACDPDSPRLGTVTDDPSYGDGRYCTSTATLTTEAGTAFDTAKWVAGNPDLGFYNSVTHTYVPIGDPRCPTKVSGGVTYTRYPCTALVLPGQNYKHLITVENIGTNPAASVDLLDVLPHVGDTGVLLGDDDRDTAWSPRPHLAGPITLDGDGTLDAEYSTVASPCVDDVPTPARDCEDGDWTPDWQKGDTAFHGDVTFDDPGLAPGGSFGIGFEMSSPADLKDPGSRDDPSLAWNSFAHSERVTVGNNIQVLPVAEPPKSGVGMVFGSLRVEKTVTGLPDGITPGMFEVAYDCVVTPDSGDPVHVRRGNRTIVAGDPVTLNDVPAGAVCRVWETETGGAEGNHTGEQNAAEVVIKPETTSSDPTVVVVDNRYPQAQLTLVKKVDDPSGGEHGPFRFEVDCFYRDQHLDGYPRTVTLDGPGRRVIAGLPVGAVCTVGEPGSAGADEVTITAKPKADIPDGASPEDPTASVSVGADGEAEVTIVNHYDHGPTPSPSESHPGDHGELPDTGDSLPWALLAIAAALLLAGTVTLLIRRKRGARRPGAHA
ncbi:hypothetical protein C1N81_41895 [Streptomyces sp. SGAir0957]